MSEYCRKRLTIEDKIELLRIVLIRLVNSADLDWDKRNELRNKLDEIIEE